VVVLCLSFGSLTWLRPGNVPDDPLRFTSHAAAFNTTGFVRSTQERRFWYAPGLLRMNVGIHPSEPFRPGKYETVGLEKRGALNRVLLGRRVAPNIVAARILLCIRSRSVGRIDLNDRWHDDRLVVIAGSALRGEQETLILAVPGAQLRTEKGRWEVTWTGLLSQ